MTDRFEKANSPHNHKEAFCLMWYKCGMDNREPGCGHMERIWNSRDGVTPFGCQCPSCGNTMFHAYWYCDLYAPDHKLHRHQKFWRDGTVEEAVAIAKRRFEIYKDQYPISEEGMKKIIDSIHNGTSTEFPPGWPTLDIKT